MVAAAGAWLSSYDANGTEPEYRKRLHNWIDGEQWLADPPLPYVDRKAAAIANKPGGKAKAKPADGVRPVKPKATTSAPEWLSQQIANGALSVSSVAGLLCVSEQHVPSILDGSATVEAYEWDLLARIAACATVDDAEKSRRLAFWAQSTGRDPNEWRDSDDPDDPSTDADLYSVVVTGGLEDWPDHLPPPHWLTGAPPGSGGGTGHPDQPSNGAASITTTPPWKDYGAWSAQLDAAGNNRVAVLCRWVRAAGAWYDASTIYIPAGLPDSYAWTVLKDYADDLEIDVRKVKAPATTAPQRPVAAS